MITYLISNYPVFYFVLSVCFIATGLSLLFTDSVDKICNRHNSFEYDVVDHLFLNLIIFSELEEDICKYRVLQEKLLIMSYSYADLFKENQPRNHKKLKVLKKVYHKTKETAIAVSTKPDKPAVVDEPVYTEIADIIRMKMNLLSCA